MIQDTLRRSQGHPPLTATPLGITLSAEQDRAMEAVLATLDQPGLRRAIGLFGLPGSGKTTLLKALCKDGAHARHTPQHRKVVCALINAANLPTDLAPWQRLIFGALDKLAQQLGVPDTVQALRNELEEVVQLEANDDASAMLAAAAFAHHMRAAFAGLIHSTITLSNATFVVAIDHLDAATPESVAQILEASKYFFNAQNCATLICADEARLIQKLGGADALRAWLTDRIELKTHRQPTRSEAAALAAPTQTSSPQPRPIASDIPQPCVQLLTETLGPDRYAVERAGDYWRAAMRALAKRSAEGYRTDVSGMMIAKLCALRVISPSLFDAIRLDAPALAALERRAHMQDSAAEGRDEWSEAIRHDARLTRLFAASPSFIGVETRHLATALRLVYGSDETPTDSVPARTARPTAMLSVAEVAAPTTRPAGRPIESSQARQRRQIAAPASLAPIGMLLTVAASAFIVDRLAKIIIQSASATTSSGLIRLQLRPEVSLIESGLAVGLSLAGLALCCLMAAFAARQQLGDARAKAYGLIAGGLTGNLFDYATSGATINYLHVADLPAFNLAHLALLAGAILLAIAVLTGSSDDARGHDADNLAHE